MCHSSLEHSFSRYTDAFATQQLPFSHLITTFCDTLSIALHDNQFTNQNLKLELEIFVQGFHEKVDEISFFCINI